MSEDGRLSMDSERTEDMMDGNKINNLVLNEDELQNLVWRLKKGPDRIELKNKKKFNEVFSGRTLMKWLAKNSNGLATTKEEVAMLFEHLMQNSIISNAKYPTITKYKPYYYYHFADEKEEEDGEEESDDEYDDEDETSEEGDVTELNKSAEEGEEDEGDFNSKTQRKILHKCSSSRNRVNFDKLIDQFTHEMLEKYHSNFSGKEAMAWITEYINNTDEWKKRRGEWKKEDAISVLQYIMDMGYLKKRSKNLAEFTPDDTKYSIVDDPSTYAINLLKQRAQSKSIGKAMSKEGAKPKFPVIIIPGLASSSLEIWQSERCPTWVGDRIWIDVAKVTNPGRLLNLKNLSRPRIPRQKTQANANINININLNNTPTVTISNNNSSEVSGSEILVREVASSKKSNEKETVTRSRSNTGSSPLTTISTDDDKPTIDLESETSKFLYHLLPGIDGFSDPKGVKVRASEGFSAIDYLSHSALSKKASYVFAYVIKELRSVGYDCKNMTVAPYDWRIPITKLQERDGYFTILKSKIEVLYEINGQTKVVPICHSMGNRVLGYFLLWVENKEKGWSDKYIESWLALGSPFLGAPKVVRGLITGDCLGLDLFLLLKEGLQIGRALGSLPSLLPHLHHRLPFPIINMALSTSSAQIADLTTERMKSYYSSWIGYQSLDPNYQFNTITRAGYDWIQVFDDQIYPLSEVEYENIAPEKIGGIWELCGNMAVYAREILEYIPPVIQCLAKTSLFNPFSIQLNIKPCDHDKLHIKVLSNGQAMGLNEVMVFYQLNQVENIFFGEGDQIAFFNRSTSLCTFTNYKEDLEVAAIHRIFRIDNLSSPSSSNLSSTTREYLNGLSSYQSGDGYYLSIKFIIRSPGRKPKILTYTFYKKLKLSCSFFVGNSRTREDKIVQGWWNSLQSHSSFYSTQSLSNISYIVSQSKENLTIKSDNLILDPSANIVYNRSLTEKFGEFYAIYKKEDKEREYPEEIVKNRIPFSPSTFKGSFQLDPSRSDNLKKLLKHVRKRGFMSKLARHFRIPNDDDMVEVIKPHPKGFKVKTYCNGVKMMSSDCLLHTFYSNYSKVMGLSNMLTFFSRDLFKQITVFVYDHGVMVKVRQMTAELIYARTIYRPNNSDNKSYCVNRIFIRQTPLPSSIPDPSKLHSNENLLSNNSLTPSSSDVYQSTSSLNSDTSMNQLDNTSNSNSNVTYNNINNDDGIEPPCSLMENGVPFYGNPSPFLTIKSQAPTSWNIFQNCYINDPLYLNNCLSSGHGDVDLLLSSSDPPMQSTDLETSDNIDIINNFEDNVNDIIESENMDNNEKNKIENNSMENGEENRSDGVVNCAELLRKLPPILDIPKVNKLWCIYGVNLDTEVSYYFRENKDNTLALDSTADKYFNDSKKKVSGGIVFETPNTPQPTLNNQARSGDGTVPYCSLNYPTYWRQLAAEHGLPCPEIDLIEVEKAEHRHMLSDDSVLYHVLYYVCYGKASPFAKKS